ncbi:MAG TPA: hypothetical protein VIR57_21000 [Chloroflexota bacterium]
MNTSAANVAAAAAAGLEQAVFGDFRLELSALGGAVVVVYMAVYTVVGWGLGHLEETIAGKPAEYASMDGLTNVLLLPLPLALGVVYDRASTASDKSLTHGEVH